MATTLDTELIPVIREALAEFGTSAKFTKRTNAQYNPMSGDVEDIGNTTMTVKCTPPSGVDTTWVNGESIRVTDQAVWLQADGLTFLPENGMAVEVVGFVFTVQSIRSVYSGDLVALYGLVVRKVGDSIAAA